MSCNVLRFTRASMLAGMAGAAIISLSAPALAQNQNSQGQNSVLTAAAGTPATTSAATTSGSTVADPGVRTLTGPQTSLNGTSPKGALSLSDESVATMDPNTKNFFQQNTARFQEVDSVSGGIGGQFPETGNGLGPRFNSNSCANCHIFPTVGGSSPPGNFTTHDSTGRTFTGNPQVTVANLDGAANTVPSFVTPNGPVREARFVHNPNGTADGGVHDLFTITGRSDAAGCTIAQPDFAAQLAAHNVIFRIPTPTFGLGLVESTPDGDQDNTIGLVGAANKQASLRSSLGIAGSFNRSGNDGTITKFGWKAQNKSLLIFAGEAYNVEQGVTNELFTNERDDTAGCRINPLPEDGTNIVNTRNTNSPASDFAADTVNFAAFMRLAGPAQPLSPLDASQTRGQTVFQNIGCGACHIQTQTTSTLSFTNTDANGNTVPQSPITFQPFSDFQVHDMGSGLADRVSQGNAEGDQFRSAPLWGVGQRVFFLHDGRTSDLLQAILAHTSGTPLVTASLSGRTNTDTTTGSEANQVINNFKALSATDQQNLLNFLRAL